METATNDKSATTILWLGAAIAASYIAALYVEAPYPIEPAWKAAGIILFALYAFSRGNALIAAALLFSAGGDILLALKTPVWIGGMAFFGIAHLLYIAAFVQWIRRSGIVRRRRWAAALVIAGSGAMLVWFAPGMNELLVPGLAYQAIITVMVVLAVLSPAPALAIAGALTFMASDTLIALGLYKDIAVPPASIWLAYMGAQFMLARGLADARGVT